MAKYTVEIRDIVQSGLRIFDFDYVFYNPDLREDFETKFINHFMFREIGLETVGRFQHYLKDKCDLVLPYYNMLLETAEYKYDLINNYTLTEKMERTTSNTKNSDENVHSEGSVNGNTSDNSTTNGSTDRNGTVTSSGDRTSTSDTTTSNTNSTESTKDDKYKDTNIVDNLQTTLVDNKKVGSDTPTGLLQMTNIENGLYASQADLEIGSNKEFIKKNEQLSKTNEAKEKAKGESRDEGHASGHDTVNDKSTDISKETSQGTVNSNGTFGNSTNSSGTVKAIEVGSGDENYTLSRIGNIGVMAPSEMLLKHTELQKTLTTIYTQFFNECEDLFMQIY